MRRLNPCTDCGSDRAKATSTDGICATYRCTACNAFIAELLIHSGP